MLSYKSTAGFLAKAQALYEVACKQRVSKMLLVLNLHCQIFEEMRAPFFMVPSEILRTPSESCASEVAHANKFVMKCASPTPCSTTCSPTCATSSASTTARWTRPDDGGLPALQAAQVLVQPKGDCGPRFFRAGVL
jgi:hypothetical protein